MRSAGVSISLFAVLACGGRSSNGGEAGGEDEGVAIDASDTTDEDSTETSDAPGVESGSGFDCDQNACSYYCDSMEDLCGVGNDGICMDDECVCVPPDYECLPCSEDACLDWESCYGEFTRDGECLVDPAYDIVFVWDAAVGCVLQLDPLLPDDPALDPYWYLDIDGMLQPRGDDCSMPESFVLDLMQGTLTLCPTACANFQTAGELHLGWGFSD